LIARCYVAGILAIMAWPPEWSGTHCLTVAAGPWSSRRPVSPVVPIAVERYGLRR
jgi:hypothetical protein